MKKLVGAATDAVYKLITDYKVVRRRLLSARSTNIPDKLCTRELQYWGQGGEE
jgi:hypothetical protein